MRIFLRKGSAGFLCLCLSLTFSKISPAVSLTWNTFLGGNSNNRGNVVAVDSTGHVYMAGWSNTTWGTPVRPYSGDYDAFVAKLDENGNLLWNTFLGGTGHDYAHAIAVASNGDVLVGGGSWDDWGNPVQPYVGGIPAFLARLDAQGNLIWNTFAGLALGENQILGIVLTP